MNAFICWSGGRELVISKTIKKWLSAVGPEIRPLISLWRNNGPDPLDGVAKQLNLGADTFSERSRYAYAFLIRYSCCDHCHLPRRVQVHSDSADPFPDNKR